MLTLLAAPASPSRYIKNIYQKEDGQTINPSGIGVAVTTSGSMTKDRFPAFCAHFVKHLPAGQGKGGEPVILVFDGHSSRWNLDGLQFLREHNVHCLCIPGHTSIWAQPNDCGPNSSFKSMLGEAIAEWRSTHLTLPGSEALVKMDRGDFNGLFVRAWMQWKERVQRQLEGVGSNAILSGWKNTGLAPYNREAPKWNAAIAKFGQREELATPPGQGTGQKSAGFLPMCEGEALERLGDNQSSGELVTRGPLAAVANRR